MFKSLLIIGSLCVCALTFSNDVTKAAAAEGSFKRQFGCDIEKMDHTASKFYDKFYDKLFYMQEIDDIDPNDPDNLLIVPDSADIKYTIISGLDPNDPNIVAQLSAGEGMHETKTIAPGMTIRIVGFTMWGHGYEEQGFAHIKILGSDDPEAIYFFRIGSAASQV